MLDLYGDAASPAPAIMYAAMYAAAASPLDELGVPVEWPIGIPLHWVVPGDARDQRLVYRAGLGGRPGRGGAGPVCLPGRSAGRPGRWRAGGRGRCVPRRGRPDPGTRRLNCSISQVTSRAVASARRLPFAVGAGDDLRHARHAPAGGLAHLGGGLDLPGQRGERSAAQADAGPRCSRPGRPTGRRRPGPRRPQPGPAPSPARTAAAAARSCCRTGGRACPCRPRRARRPPRWARPRPGR